MRVIVSFFIILLLMAAGFFTFIYSGILNVAASAPYSSPARWVVKTTLENSVRARAGEIKPPPLGVLDAEQGFLIYEKVCVVCHGAPGLATSEIALGLRPEPPYLSRHLDNWTAAELFWIISNGFKYTGMPAFSATHAESDRWKLVAFLLELPGISAEQYQQLRQRLDPQAPDEQPSREIFPYQLQPYEEQKPQMMHQQEI